MRSPTCFSLFALTLFTSTATAQIANRVVPRMWTHGEALSAAPFPFYTDKGRVQHLIEGSRFCAKDAVLFGISYRIDGKHQGAKAAITLPNLTIALSYTSNSAQTMSTTFASNIAGAQTTVLSGSFNLPAQSTPSTSPTPFNINCKFSRPFVYTRKQGNLLVEHLLPGQATGQLDYPMFDHAFAGMPWANWGTGGSFADNSQPMITLADPTPVVPGGNVLPINRGLTQAYPTVHIYGFSSDSYGPIALPFSLTPFGAPGNTLYVSLDLLAPVVPQALGSVFEARSTLPIPNANDLVGVPLFMSSLHVDLKANAMGLVFGPAISTTVGWQTTTGTNILYATDSTQAAGQLIGTSGDGGPVVQLNGTFN